MARVENGNLIGNVGNLNYYQRGGETFARKRRGKNKNRARGKQREGCLKLKIATHFVSLIGEFIKASFVSEGKEKQLTPYNSAMSEILNHAITGEAPNQQLDMTKVLVAKGRLVPPINPVMTYSDNRLLFTWDVLDHSWPSANERVMFLAYAPELGEVIYDLAGAKRSKGADFLSMNASWLGKKIETYIAFRAETGNMVSNSVYTGSTIFYE
jgi:hypothetical protein